MLLTRKPMRKHASWPHSGTHRPKPWPSFFIVRSTGELIPLIAVDGLPLGTDLLGVPRSFDLEATMKMRNLGLQGSSGSFYQVHEARDKVLSNLEACSYF